MKWLAVHRSERGSIAARQAILSKDDVVACESAASLLQHLEARQTQHEAEYAQAMKEAHAAGFAQGRLDGMAMVRDQLMTQWGRLAEQALADTVQFKQALIVLSAQIVQRIAGQLAPEDVLLALARQAMVDAGLAQERQTVILRVHPDWADVLAARAHIDPLSDIPCQVEVRADSNCTMMDLIIETPIGEILAGLDTQLSSIVRNLNDGAT
jgi:flagellar biosynthesis/type III secretory pathway protein FliH